MRFTLPLVQCYVRGVNKRGLHWAIALNFCTPGVEEQWNSSGVSYKSCGILQGLSKKSWNSLGVKH